MNPLSPLRYPGGKQMLSRVLGHLIRANDLEGGAYAEPYAGGAGAALALLFSENVSRLLLNDADPSIYAMWTSILCHTEEFVRLVADAPLTVEEWKKQKSIYSSKTEHSPVELGFSTFYLNRTNRSGIIKNAGPIGGYDQSGPWKIDARFNRKDLPKRLERIALYKKKISFKNLDAVEFINSIRLEPRLFVYLDPPYFEKGRELYLNHYRAEDHCSLATFMKKQKGFKWVMSYDQSPYITTLYKELLQVSFNLSYSATVRREGKEVLIVGEGLKFPREWKRMIPDSVMAAA